MISVSQERLTYLRDFLRDRLDEGTGGDVFINDGHDRIVWIGTDEPEVIVIKLAAGTIEVKE